MQSEFNGRLAVARETPTEARIGVARGAFEAPADIDAANADVAKLFNAGDRRVDEVHQTASPPSQGRVASGGRWTSSHRP